MLITRDFGCNHVYGSKFPPPPKKKPRKFWVWICISSQIFKNIQIPYLQNYQIEIKFDMLMRTVTAAPSVVLYDDITVQRWRMAAILNFKNLLYNSVADWDVGMKFCMLVKSNRRKSAMCLKTAVENQFKMAAGQAGYTSRCHGFVAKTITPWYSHSSVWGNKRSATIERV